MPEIVNLLGKIVCVKRIVPRWERSLGWVRHNLLHRVLGFELWRTIWNWPPKHKILDNNKGHVIAIQMDRLKSVKQSSAQDGDMPPQLTCTVFYQSRTRTWYCMHLSRIPPAIEPRQISCYNSPHKNQFHINFLRTLCFVLGKLPNVIPVGGQYHGSQWMLRYSTQIA